MYVCILLVDMYADIYVCICMFVMTFVCLDIIFDHILLYSDVIIFFFGVCMYVYTCLLTNSKNNNNITILACMYL